MHIEIFAQNCVGITFLESYILRKLGLKIHNELRT